MRTYTQGLSSQEDPGGEGDCGQTPREVSRSQGEREWREEEALFHVPETGPPGQGVPQSQAADQCTR